MRTRNLAWVLWAVTVSLVGGALVLGLANRPEVPLFDAPLTIIPPTFATLGALISSRRPGNVMGWIFLATGILGGVQMFSGQYATVALVPDGPTLPGAPSRRGAPCWPRTRSRSPSCSSYCRSPTGCCPRAAGDRWPGQWGCSS